MPTFSHGNVEIAYLDEGQGEPIVLVHGFASNKEVNWVEPGWTATLTGAGRRVIALDNRGHGQSTKFYDPSNYRMTLMAGDLRALLDHLRLPRADVMGYSMGARISAFFAVEHPQRVRSLILGGIGIKLVTGAGLPDGVVAALEAPSLEQVSDATGRMFRKFAEKTNSDLRALVACIRGARETLTPEQIASVKTPVLIAVGNKDTVAGDAAALAALFPHGRALEIPDRDHMLAVGDKQFKAAAIRFLNDRP